MTLQDAQIMARIGQYIILEPRGRVVAIQDIITSWAATTYRLEADGSVARIA